MYDRRAVRLALAVVLAAGCNRGRPVPDPGPPADDGRPRLQQTVGVWSSPFLARCRADPARGGLLARLLDESLGADRGEVLWGVRSFGDGGEGGGGDHYEVTREYGGYFVFRKDGAERRVSAGDADATLRALKASLERELKASGVRLTDDTAAEDGKRMTGFRLGYEDPGMPAAGSVEASIALPTGDRGMERLARLTFTHRESSRRDRLRSGG